MPSIVEVRPFIISHGRGNMVIVRVRADDGAEGYGEGTIPHKARAIAGAVEDFAEYLVGKDDSQIERHWQVLFRNSFHRGGIIQLPPGRDEQRRDRGAQPGARGRRLSRPEAADPRQPGAGPRCPGRCRHVREHLGGTGRRRPRCGPDDRCARKADAARGAGDREGGGPARHPLLRRADPAAQRRSLP